MYYLADLRKERMLSQNELGKIMNVSGSAIAMYETGKRSPSLKRALKFSEYFNIPLEQIKFSKENKNKSKD